MAGRDPRRPLHRADRALPARPGLGGPARGARRRAPGRCTGHTAGGAGPRTPGRRARCRGPGPPAGRDRSVPAGARHDRGHAGGPARRETRARRGDGGAVRPAARAPDRRRTGRRRPRRRAGDLDDLRRPAARHDRAERPADAGGVTPRAGVFALGDPRPTHQPLRWGEAEAHTLAELGGDPGRARVGDAATRAWLLDAMRDGELVGAACHGYFDGRDILRSGLMLAGGERFTLADAFALHDEVSGLPLLILSACQAAVVDLRGRPARCAACRPGSCRPAYGPCSPRSGRSTTTPPTCW
ncbi:CHAT domain-containing protein [Actinoplanes sp. CA-252034]|uniref:CHAT domain-containing protein n=1 Tax=Actinoplanes sp. CA-252034 TaxID=3239906 RepID=UPI003D963394